MNKESVNRVDTGPDIVYSGDVMREKAPTNRRATGDCYEIAGKTAMGFEFDPRKARVVHGMVVGVDAAGAETPRHGHAWIESAGRAFDRSNGHDVELPVDLYRRLGRVTDATEYTFEEAKAHMCASRHFGPWEEIE